MTHETMTVHKALAELKIIDDRILNAINSVAFIDSVKNGTKKIKGVSDNQQAQFSEACRGYVKRDHKGNNWR